LVFQEEEISRHTTMDGMEVYALVGSSGTGKSHRAMAVAQELSCDAIIDDGLLIAGSRIVAGRSAKREATKTAAVRRAVFSSPGHVLEVKEGLENLTPSRLLVLGTSEGMIKRIISRLGLPEPVAIVNIEEFASIDEINQALWYRKQEGKHVIPAPTFEVKKTFSGYFVDPIHMFTKSRELKQHVTEKSVVRPTYSSFGRFYIADGVIMQITHRICYDVTGVRRVLKALAMSTGEGAILDVELVLDYGYPVFEIMAQVQKQLKEKLEYMTGIYLQEINVSTKKISLE
jgi:uncharacterized alkaline shock family protein YloU